MDLFGDDEVWFVITGTILSPFHGLPQDSVICKMMSPQ